MKPGEVFERLRANSDVPVLIVGGGINGVGVFRDLALQGIDGLLDGADVLAESLVPYFNCTGEHFCSHRHTPSSGQVGYPAVVRKGNAITFAHAILSQYDSVAPRWYTQLVANALAPLLRHNGPSILMARVNAQEGRRVVYLLHYIPTRRGRELDII